MVNISTCNARSPPVMASIYFIPWVKEVWLEEVTFFNRWYKRGVPFCQKWDKKKVGGWTPWCGSRTTLPSQEISFMNDSTGAVKFNPREAWKIIRDSRRGKNSFCWWAKILSFSTGNETAFRTSCNNFYKMPSIHSIRGNWFPHGRFGILVIWGPFRIPISSLGSILEHGNREKFAVADLVWKAKTSAF